MQVPLLFLLIVAFSEMHGIFQDFFGISIRHSCARVREIAFLGFFTFHKERHAFWNFGLSRDGALQKVGKNQCNGEIFGEIEEYILNLLAVSSIVFKI